MATEVTVDRSGLDGFDWDSQGVGLVGGALLLGGAVGGASRRGGVIPAVLTPLKYVLTSGLIGTIKAGTYAVPHPDTSLGVHYFVLPNDFAITHTTAHASQPRTDLIIVELNDVGTSSSTAKFRLLSGTAGSGAPAPTLPTSLGNGAAFALASVNVPANATTLGTITDLRTFTVAAGGQVPVANTAAAAELPIGTPYFDLALDRPGVRRASGTGLVTPPWAALGFANSVVVGTIDSDMSKAKWVGGKITKTPDASGLITVTTGLSQYVMFAMGSNGTPIISYVTFCALEASTTDPNNIIFRCYDRRTGGFADATSGAFTVVWAALGL